jgi:sporulation protein YlmC with PRC-barrel domain
MPSALSYAAPMDGFTSARRLALSSAAVLLLAACDTARQEASLPAPPPPRPGTTPPAATGLSAWRLGELIGRTVYNREGQAIGVVDDVVVHRRDRSTAAVLRMGGFLWFGGDFAVVPVRQLRLQGDAVVAPNLTRAVLERVDNYQPRDWDSADRERLVGAAR